MKDSIGTTEDKQKRKEEGFKQLFTRIYKGDKKNGFPALLRKYDISMMYSEYFPGSFDDVPKNLPKSSAIAYRFVFACKLLMCAQRADIKTKLSSELVLLERKISEHFEYTESVLENIFLVFPAGVRITHDRKTRKVKISLGGQKKYEYSDIGVSTLFGKKEQIAFAAESLGDVLDVKNIRIKKVANLRENRETSMIRKEGETCEMYLNGKFKMYCFENMPNVMYYSNATIIRSSEYLLSLSDGVQIFFKKERQDDKDLGVYRVCPDMIKDFSKYVGIEGHKSIIQLQDQTKPTIASIILPTGEIFETEVKIHFWKIQEQKVLEDGVRIGEHWTAHELVQNLRNYGYENLCNLYYFFDVYATFCHVPRTLRLFSNPNPTVFTSDKLEKTLQDGLSILTKQEILETTHSKSVIGIMKMLFSNENNLIEKEILKSVEEELEIERTNVGRPKEEHRQAILERLLKKIEEHDTHNQGREFHKIYSNQLMNIENVFANKNASELTLLKILLIFLLMNKDNKKKFAFNTSLFPLDETVIREMEKNT